MIVSIIIIVLLALAVLSVCLLTYDYRESIKQLKECDKILDWNISTAQRKYLIKHKYKLKTSYKKEYVRITEFRTSQDLNKKVRYYFVLDNLHTVSVCEKKFKALKKLDTPIYLFRYVERTWEK